MSKARRSPPPSFRPPRGARHLVIQRFPNGAEETQAFETALQASTQFAAWASDRKRGPFRVLWFDNEEEAAREADILAPIVSEADA